MKDKRNSDEPAVAATANQNQYKQHNYNSKKKQTHVLK